MVPMASSQSKADDDGFPAEEIVFSCSICQATLSEVYAIAESNHGFHSGSGDEHGIVTKMWIAECSHITCAKHLDNGAAPFHPKNETPRAPCPRCMKDHGDDNPKALYRVQGLEEGQYDPTIPDMWIQCPAMKLDASIPGMEGVRFQYMALLHYARQVRKHWKSGMQKQSAMETAYSKERKVRRQAHSDLLELKNHVETLQEAKGKLERWEKRKPEIDHYLYAFGDMAKDNEEMRMSLLQLGYHFPQRKYTFNPEQSGHEDRAQITAPNLKERPAQEAFINAQMANVEIEGSSSSRKRKRDDRQNVQLGHDRMPHQKYRVSSRDLMPPPLPKPINRQHIPSAATGKSAEQTARLIPNSSQAVEPYENQLWRPAGEGNDVERHYLNRDSNIDFDRSQLRRNWPVGLSKEPWDLPTVFSRYGTPLQSTHHRDPPQERSPRNSHGGQMLAQLSLQSPGKARTSPDRPALQRQPLERQLVPAYHERVSQRLPSYAPEHQARTPQRAGQAGPQVQPFAESYQKQREPTNSLAYNSQRNSFHENKSHIPVASVISPFFRRSSAASRPTTVRPPARGSAVQTHDARSIPNIMSNYQMDPKSVSAPLAPGEPRSINGLSFIDKPHRSTDNRPLYQSRGLDSRMTSTYHERFALPQTPRNSQGLFQRPDRPPPSATYAPNRPQATMYHRGGNQSPSRRPHPPIAASEDEALAQIQGVRGVSSHRRLPTYHRPSAGLDTQRTLYSAAGGRRSVRR